MTFILHAVETLGVNVALTIHPQQVIVLFREELQHMQCGILLDTDDAVVTRRVVFRVIWAADAIALHSALSRNVRKCTGWAGCRLGVGLLSVRCGVGDGVTTPSHCLFEMPVVRIVRGHFAQLCMLFCPQSTPRCFQRWR